MLFVWVSFGVFISAARSTNLGVVCVCVCVCVCGGVCDVCVCVVCVCVCVVCVCVCVVCDPTRCVT